MPINVLIIEDDPVWSFMFIKELPINQFITKLAINIAEAKQFIANEEFDLICLDLQLPDSRQGKDTLLTMTSLVKYTPIIVITSLDDTKIKNYALSLGVQEFIVKSKFNAKTFVQSSLATIKNMQDKFENKITKDLKLIIDKLKNLESLLQQI